MTSRQMSGDLERKALELMPWYVNGTLEGDERELVGRQVSTSLACRKELGLLRRLQQLIQRDDAEMIATDREFERLMARIHASDSPPRMAAAAGGSGFASRRFALAASVAAAVAALLWWGSLTPSAPPHVFETLTSSQPGDPEAVRLRVLFAPGVTGLQQRELLASHGLTVLGSPGEDGVVTLAFPAGADRAAIVAALKQDARIRLVTSPPPSGGP